MDDPAAREQIIRKLAAALGLTDDETTAVLATPSEYAHWSQVYDDMAEEIRARVGRIDLSAVALEAVASDPRFAEYRNQFESGDFVIDYAARDEMRAANERLNEHIARAAAEQIRHGFGDLTAPLAEGEYVHSAKTCPHEGCDWMLPMEWRNERNAQTTRLRGLLEADALAQGHLEEHALANWKGPDIA
ncbi:MULTISPECIES: hypothetical protein [Nocardia]|uniref:hypothetical protein n=1 Tax=Nocardia TaxID=1817 RepID=UPI0024576BC7|nr:MULTISPECIES: hypothetical protein [Nocardia]